MHRSLAHITSPGFKSKGAFPNPLFIMNQLLMEIVFSPLINYYKLCCNTLYQYVPCKLWDVAQVRRDLSSSLRAGSVAFIATCSNQSSSLQLLYLPGDRSFNKSPGKNLDYLHSTGNKWGFALLERENFFPEAFSAFSSSALDFFFLLFSPFFHVFLVLLLFFFNFSLYF